MFITPFPIIFLQIKVSPWHLFPWQRRRYFTLLPSTLNLSGYENSSCVFSSLLATLALSVQHLKTTSWGSFLIGSKVKCGWCSTFLSLSLPLVLILSSYHPLWVWRGSLVEFICGISSYYVGLRRAQRCHETNPVFNRFCLIETEGKESGGEKKNLPR